MKNKVLDILISIFLLCDIALFGLLMILVLCRGGHIYSLDNYKTISTSTEKLVLDIYDESLYVHHEPDFHLFTVDRNGKTYMSFSTQEYDVQVKNDSIILEYEHNHSLRFYIF